MLAAAVKAAAQEPTARFGARYAGNVARKSQHNVPQLRGGAISAARHPSAMAPPREGCWTCQGRRFWRHKVAGHWVCARCHPPSFPEWVAGWHEAPQPALPWVVGLPRPMTLREIQRRAGGGAADDRPA